MEYRKRHVGQSFDEENPPQRGVSSSRIMEDAINEHNEYVYNGVFYPWRAICQGMKNIICPCLRNTMNHFIVKDDPHNV